jgi:predicted lipoprotein
VALAGLVLLTAGAAGEDVHKPFDHLALARAALEQHIRPGYERLAQAAENLHRELGQSCAGQDQDARKKVVAAFDGIITAWGRIEHIDFGPVAKGNRLERILFWPDRRGLGARQVSRVIASRDASVLEPAQLAKKSVALQGLGALEAALFADRGAQPSTEDRTFHCGYTHAIAGNLTRIARAIVAEWSAPDGYAAQWLAPGPSNPAFLKPTETTLALAKSFDQGIERVRDQRIAGPLGLNAQRQKTLAVFALSGRTLLFVTSNIEGLQDLYAKGGIGQGFVDTGFRSPEVNVRTDSDAITRELKQAEEVSRSLIGATNPFGDRASWQRLVDMGFPLRTARIQAANLFTQAADLTLGFNSSDGD